jgi:hypothetical protein
MLSHTIGKLSAEVAIAENQGELVLASQTRRPLHGSLESHARGNTCGRLGSRRNGLCKS